MSNFDKAVLTVLKHEGGFVNDPNDPGGATNYGVSIRWLVTAGDMDKDGFLDGDLDHDGDIDISDIKNMTQDQAIALYKNGFWNPNKLDNITSFCVAEKTFDMVVNMGGKQAIKIVQRSCNFFGKTLTVDGVVGANTFNAINSIDEQALLREIRVEQAQFYLDLIAAKPSLAKFKNGWLRRAAS